MYDRIKFPTKQKPLGMKAGKNWNLIANAIRESMTTNVIGSRVAEMVGAAAANHFLPVELYINGNYRGSYTLTEKVGISNNSIDLANDQLKPITDRLRDLPNGKYPNNNYLLAAFKAHGECLNAQLIAIILNEQGVKARFVDPKAAGLTVTGSPNNASIAPESYQALENFEYEPDEKLIFPGFYGYTLAGHIATFSRGGSDITGAILARGFHADLYENFTDVDAIFSANPAVVDHPLPSRFCR